MQSVKDHILINNNNNNNEKFILCHRHVAEEFPPARQGTILSSHRVIGIATNTSMVLNCALVTYIMMTENVGLPDAVLRRTPRTHHCTEAVPDDPQVSKGPFVMCQLSLEVKACEMF